MIIGFAMGLTAIVAVAQGGSVPADAGGPLTIDQAVAIAERNAFAVRVARTNVEQNRQRVAEARGRLGPQLSVGSTYTRFGQESSATFPGPPGEPPQTIVTQPANNTVANAQVSLPIDISGNLGRIVSANRANLRASERTLEATVSDARLNARRAFFNALRAQGLVNVAQSAVRSALERLEQARKQFAGDQIARVDVVRYEALVSQNYANLIQARNNYTLAREALNAALARPIETPVEPVEVTALPAPPAGPDVLVRTAQEGRPEVRSLGQTLEALANVRRAEERGLNPSLAVSLGYQRNLGTVGGFGGREETATGTFAFSLPVFDAGITRARVRAARQDEERLQVQIEQLRLGISQEVRAALNNLDSARGRHEGRRVAGDAWRRRCTAWRAFARTPERRPS